MQKLIRTLMLTFLITLLAPAAVVLAQDNAPKTPAAPSASKQALAKLKTLSGSWQGKIMDIPINFTIRAVSSGTAVLHEGHTSNEGPPKNEITMFYRDGDRLLATHFCDAGNRTHMEGKLSADEKTITFSFLEVVGTTRGGYLKDMVITMIDADRHKVAITFIMPDGKPIPFGAEFQQTK